MPYILDTYRTKTGDSLGRIINMRESGKVNPKRGVFKTAENTEAMLRYAAMRMRHNQVHISQFISVGAEQTVEGALEKVYKQMDGYKLQQKVKSDRFADAQFKWMGENEDDQLVSLMHGMYWEQHFWLSNREDYEEEKKRL